MNPDGDSAVHRAISILAWFNRERATTTASELSEQLNIPKATVYRIINDLREWGLIERETSTNRYRLGPRVLEFASAYNQSTSLSAVAQPFLAELRDETGETVSLNIILDHERICILEARSIHALNWAVPPGTRGPLYAGSTGKAILAFLHPEKLEELQTSIELESITPDTPTTWKEILAELPEIRKTNYCTTIGEVTPGVGGLAAPILNQEGYSIGSINLSAPLIRWEKETVDAYIPLVKMAAATISKEHRGM